MKIPNFHSYQTVYKGWVYKFVLQVPIDLQGKLGKKKLTIHLGENMKTAIAECYKLNTQYRALFKTLRNPNSKYADEANALLLAHDVPNRKLSEDELWTLPHQVENEFDKYPNLDEMPKGLRKAFDTIHGKDKVYLSDALDFFKAHKRPLSDKTYNDSKYIVNLFVTAIADLPIDEIKRDHVRNFIEFLQTGDKRNNIKAMRNASILKRLGTIGKLIKFYMIEKDMNPWVIPFFNFKLDTGDSTMRRPYTKHEYHQLFDKAVLQPDDARLALLLIASTGCRLSEGIGVLVKDLHLDDEIPNVDIYANPLRTLKTKASKRTVPLVYAPLVKMLKRFTEDKGEETPVFARYAGNGNTFSATIGKWLDKNVPAEELGDGYKRANCHSLRHGMAQMLKDVECPTPVINQCLGWTQEGMTAVYGGELDLKVKQKWMKQGLDKLLTI